MLPIEGSFYVVWYKRGAPMVGNHIHKGESLADRWNWSKGPVSWAYIAKQVATT